MADHVAISKTLSYWLRHRPDEAALALDGQGWAEVEAVLAALARRGMPDDIDTLLDVVEYNDKQRFEVSSDLSRIRARQGRSIAVDLALTPATPPDLLYHGAPARSVAAILAEGLHKMRRHHVHLLPDVETAHKVGARRGRPAVFKVNAAALLLDGGVFYLTANGVWLTDAVAPRYLSLLAA
jgi:putative RNA 2'-phosphotransferase